MRILSLGFPLPGPAVDNHTLVSAPTFFDYDALVVDPNALSQLIEEVLAGSTEHRTRSGEPVAAIPDDCSSIALAELLRDRRDETARLIARGGLVVCLAFPNVSHAVPEFAGCDRYCWLPAPPGLAYREPLLRRGYGAQLAPAEVEHPFSGFIEQFRTTLTYQAYFDDETPGFAEIGAVFARSAGGAAVSVELRLDRGRIVFLPPPTRPLAGDQRYEFSGALQEAVGLALNPPASLQ
jgi:hypothetical protein